MRKKEEGKKDSCWFLTGSFCLYFLWMICQINMFSLQHSTADNTFIYYVKFNFYWTILMHILVFLHFNNMLTGGLKYELFVCNIIRKCRWIIYAVKVPSQQHFRVGLVFIFDGCKVELMERKIIFSPLTIIFTTITCRFRQAQILNYVYWIWQTNFGRIGMFCTSFHALLNINALTGAWSMFLNWYLMIILVSVSLQCSGFRSRRSSPR